MTRALIFCLSLLLLGLISAMLVPRLVPHSFWEARVERQLAAQTGMNVDVGAEVRFQLLPRPALDVRNLKLTSPSVISLDVAPTLEVANATAFLRLWPSLLGDIRVQHLMLNQPTLRITRDEDQAAPSQNGLMTLADLLGAGPQSLDGVSDDLLPIISTMERIDIAEGRLRVDNPQGPPEVVIELPAARIERDQKGSDIGWTARIHQGDWRAEGSGRVDFAVRNDAPLRRPFQSQWRLNNVSGAVAVDRFTIDGDLTDHVLSSLTVSEDDGWKGSVHGLDAALLDSLNVALGVPLSVTLDLDRLQIGAGQIKAGNLHGQIDLVDDTTASLRGDAAILFAPTGRTLALNILVDADTSEGLLRSMVLDRRQAIAAIVGKTSGLKQIAFNLESDHSNAFAPIRQVQWALSGQLTDKGAEVDDARLTVPRSHTVAFDQGVIPLEGDEVWQGSLQVETAGFEWLNRFLPEAVILGAGAETVRFDGEFWPRGRGWTSADWFQGRLEADGKRSFNLKRQTLGAAKHLSITSAKMDLEWLPDRGHFDWPQAEPYAGAYVTTLLKRTNATALLADALDASRLTLRVDRGFDGGQTFRDLLINVTTNAPIDVETDIVKATLAFVTKANKRILTSLRGTLLSWRNHLSLPDTWLSDSRVAIESAAPIFVEFDEGQRWLFQQEDRTLTIPVGPENSEPQGNVQWQRNDVSLQTLLSPLGPVASLFNRDPLPIEGTAIPGTRPLGRSLLSPVSGDDNAQLELIWGDDRVALTAENFAAFAFLPTLETATVNVAMTEQVVDSWQAQGAGWTANAIVDPDQSHVSLEFDQISLNHALSVMVSPEFQRGMANQPDVSVNMHIKRLMDQRGTLLATDVHLDGEFFEAGLQLQDVRATLANGLTVSSLDPQQVCTRSPCRFEWVLGSWGHGLIFGPFEIRAAPNDVRLVQELFVSTDADQADQEMIFHLEQHPIEFSSFGDAMDVVWTELFATELGPAFQALLAERVAGSQFLATGSIKKNDTGWSTRNLLLSASGPQASPLTILLDGELDASLPEPGLNGQVLFDIDGKKAILTLSGPIDQLDLSLLGAYFRE